MLFSAVASVFEPSVLDSLSNVILGLIILVWKLFWYAIAIFKTIERKQIRWFVVLFIGLFLLIFDLGLIAIIYLILYKSPSNKKSNSSKVPNKKTKKRK